MERGDGMTRKYPPVVSLVFVAGLSVIAWCLVFAALMALGVVG